MTSSTVELAVAAFALRKGLIEVVQAAMLGAILNNLLLVNYQPFIHNVLIWILVWLFWVHIHSPSVPLCRLHFFSLHT